MRFNKVENIDRRHESAYPVMNPPKCPFLWEIYAPYFTGQ